MNRKYAGAAIFLIILFISGNYLHNYHANYNYSLRNRTEIAAQNNPEIHIAVAWDLLHEKSFVDGAKLAFKEVNAQGITLNANDKPTVARIVLHEFDDGSDEKAEDSWLAIADNHQIVAVIGHSSSASAIPASISYEYNGILFISTIATDPALTSHNFKYTFSITPSDKYFVGKLIEYARQHQLFKLIILYARNDYGINFYQEFTSQLGDDFEIIASRSFFPTQEDMAAGNLNTKTDIIYPIMQQNFDALVLIARDELGAEMIRQLRTMGITHPILGGDGLDNHEIWDMSHQSSNNTFVTSVFAEYDQDAKNRFNNPQTVKIMENFKRAYGYTPGYLAFQGYDAAMILASAFQLTGSTVPIKVAATLRFHYQHGYNNYMFDLNGMVANKKIFIKEMIDGKSKMIGSETIP